MISLVYSFFENEAENAVLFFALIKLERHFTQRKCMKFSLVIILFVMLEEFIICLNQPFGILQMISSHNFGDMLQRQCFE
jgi:hypothetical protein